MTTQNNTYSTATTGTQIATGSCAIHNLILTAAATNASAQVYDNTSATGNPIFNLNCPANDTRSIDLTAWPTVTTTGIYVVLNGTGATLTTTYDQ